MSYKCLALVLLVAASLVSAQKTAIRVQNDAHVMGACEGCQFVVGMIEQEVIAPNKKTIEAYMADVCDIVPASVRPSCVQLVNSYSDQVINYVLSHYTPDAACTAIGLCKSARLDTLLALPLTKARDQNLCTECESGVFFAQLYLKSNTTLQEINAMVKKTCAQLFPSNPSQCVALVNIGLQYVLNFINNNTPQTICQDLKLCTAFKRLFAEVRALGDAPACSLCETVANWGEKELSSPNVENTLVALVSNVCTVLPASWTAQCDSFVSGLLPQLIAQAIANYPPNALCALVKLC